MTPEAHARNIALKLQSSTVGVIDPLTILAVLSFLIQAWRVCYLRENSERTLQEQLRWHCATPLGRNWLVRRAARQVKKRSNVPMRLETARSIATQAIDLALTMPAEELEAFDALQEPLSATDKDDVLNGDD